MLSALHFALPSIILIQYLLHIIHIYINAYCVYTHIYIHINVNCIPITRKP